MQRLLSFDSGSIWGRRVWTVCIGPQRQEALDGVVSKNTGGQSWSVPMMGRPNDLVLVYRSGTRAAARKHGADESLLQGVANVFVVKSRPYRSKKWGWMADVGNVARLQDPLRLSLMKSDLTLKTAGFVRASLQGRQDVTAHWHRLHHLIVKLNPGAERRLRKFAPWVS